MAKHGENIRKRKDGRWEGRFIKGRKSDRTAIWGYIYGHSYDLFIDLKHSTNLRTTAKELVVPERQFVRFLLEQRFVYRTASGNVLPYAKPSNDGLFCVKDFCNHGHIGSYTLVTPQGKLHFAELRDLILMVCEITRKEAFLCRRGKRWAS